MRRTPAHCGVLVSVLSGRLQIHRLDMGRYVSEEEMLDVPPDELVVRCGMVEWHTRLAVWLGCSQSLPASLRPLR